MKPNWTEICIKVLDENDLFASAFHKSRYIDAFDSIKTLPFFNKGLAKCAYVASCDQPHMNLFLSAIHSMEQQNRTDTAIIKDAWEAFIHNVSHMNENENALFKLACFFLDHPEKEPDESCLLILSREWIDVGDRCIQVSHVIDQL